MKPTQPSCPEHKANKSHLVVGLLKVRDITWVCESDEWSMLESKKSDYESNAWRG